MANEREIVLTFHEHFNAGERARVLAMATDDIAVGGMQGKRFLEEWVGRATTTMTPRRWFQQGGTVVVEELVEWRSRTSGEVTDQVVWGIAFTIENGRITAMSRHGDIGEAVNKAGLDASHEVDAPGGG